jgi:hypothetical protein
MNFFNQKLRNTIFDLKSKGWKKKDILKHLSISNNKYIYVTVREDYLDKRISINKKNMIKYKEKEFYVLDCKVKRFQSRASISVPYTYKDVLNKFGSNPICYLTGLSIDYNNSKQYHLDHIMPTSKGGTSDLSNMGICIATANNIKKDLLLKDFLKICKQVASYHNLI